MGYQTLAVEKKSSVATIWMDRPDVYNAFNESLIHELSDALIKLESDPEVRVLVLAGKGKHFSAGADLNWMKRASEMEEAQNLADAQVFASMMYKLANFSKPTIARIQGAALGGGTGLAAACNIVIASEDAKFAVSEVKFGIIPAVISPYVLRAIGVRQATRYFLTAETIDAEQALKINLVHKLVPLAELDDAVDDMVATLHVGGPNAQKAALDLIKTINEMPLTQQVIVETASRITIQRQTDEAKEGMNAFFEKRSPDWII